MTRLTIRTLLRRLVQEDTADNWTDAVLNDLIDHAYARMIGEVKRVDPEAFVATSTSNIVAGTATYAKPADNWSLVEVNLLDSATGLYKPIRRVEYDKTRPPSTGSDFPTFSDTVWYHSGTSVGIYPAPTASVTNGLQFRYFPNDALSADTNSPVIHVSLHYGIVLWGALLAKGETQEDVAPLRVQLNEILVTLREIYTRDLNVPQALQPMTRGLRRGGSQLEIDPRRPW